MISFLLEVTLKDRPQNLEGLFKVSPEFTFRLLENEFEFLAWGDPIPGRHFTREIPKCREVRFIINNLYGHYYYLLLDRLSGELFAGNSLFSILPVYYNISGGRIIISDNALSLGRHIKSSSISRRFILETVLFNYPLFNHTAVEGVTLLPSNSFMSVRDGEVTITRHTGIARMFSSSPVSWRKSAGLMTDIFLDAVKKYFPDQQYFNSLTGGFDSRTLAASGLYHKRSFAGYCFGSCSSEDMQIASELSAAAHLPFMPVHLDETYAGNDSLDCGKEFIESSSGVGTFARAHYIHAARKLAGIAAYIITGNFGSELLRAVHVPGVVMAPNLISLFRASDVESAVRALEMCHEWNYLNRVGFGPEWDAFKDDIGRLPCFNTDYDRLTGNQKFYVFVFEEIFRKYFGTEITVQFSYLKNRTPFLDMDFIRELLGTGFAGIHSDFFEQNPVRRYKGQVLYAKIIHEAFPFFGKIRTDKGYKPDDLLTLPGGLRIAKGYLAKHIAKGEQVSDPYGVAESWKFNRNYFMQLTSDAGLFNTVRIKNEITGRPSGILIRLYSLIYLDHYYRSYVKEENG
jgi:hypothetical protein